MQSVRREARASRRREAKSIRNCKPERQPTDSQSSFNHLAWGIEHPEARADSSVERSAEGCNPRSRYTLAVFCPHVPRRAGCQELGLARTLVPALLHRSEGSEAGTVPDPQTDSCRADTAPGSQDALKMKKWVTGEAMSQQGHLWPELGTEQGCYGKVSWARWSTGADKALLAGTGWAVAQMSLSLHIQPWAPQWKPIPLDPMPLGTNRMGETDS